MSYARLMSNVADDDSPITLAEACEKIFAGKIKAATLRAEAERGYLTIFRIGRRDFTTPAFVREMVRKKCSAAAASRADPTAAACRSATNLTESQRLAAANAALIEYLAEQSGRPREAIEARLSRPHKLRSPSSRL